MFFYVNTIYGIHDTYVRNQKSSDLGLLQGNRRFLSAGFYPLQQYFVPNKKQKKSCRFSAAGFRNILQIVRCHSIHKYAATQPAIRPIWSAGKYTPCGPVRGRDIAEYNPCKAAPLLQNRPDTHRQQSD